MGWKRVSSGTCALAAFYEGAFTSMRLVPRSDGRGWFLFC